MTTTKTELAQALSGYFLAKYEANYSSTLAADFRANCRPEDADAAELRATEQAAKAETLLASLKEMAPTKSEVFELACELDAAGQTPENQHFIWAVSKACHRGDARVPAQAEKHFLGFGFCR